MQDIPTQDDWPVIVRRLLCVYAYYGNPTECKLSLFQGSRAYQDADSLVLPLALNIFSTGNVPAQTAVGENFLKYIVEIQANYFHCLGTSRTPLEPVDESNVYDSLMRRHWQLCELDGTPRGDDSFKAEFENTTPWFVPSADLHLAAISKEAIEARKQLQRFIDTCDNVLKVKPFFSPNQAATEVMQYMTHITRALRDSLNNKPDDSARELCAGGRHLTRTTLDMRKSIIVTVFKNRPEIVGRDLRTRILKSRIRECEQGVDATSKRELFKTEANELCQMAEQLGKQ